MMAAITHSKQDDPNARPGTVERYSVAAVSGGDFAMHGAAGMLHARHGLGLALLRMRAEFDSIRGQMLRNNQAAKDRQAAFESLQKRAINKAIEADAARALAEKAPDFATASRWEAAAASAEVAATHLAEEAAHALKRAPVDILCERAEVLQTMTTLEPAKRLLMARATVLATKRQFMEPNERVAVLLGKVLDVYLDVTCHTCDGTGSVGSIYAGEKPRTCRVCRGSGHRRDTIGESAAQRMFASHLMAEMQQAAATAGAELRKRLRGEQF
jgi:hypothetical protein